MEIEENGKLPFLDVLVTKKADNTLGLQRNGYNKEEVNRTINKQRSEIKRTDTQESQEEKKWLSFLPYVKGTTDRIGKILNKHNIRTIFKPPRKIEQILRNPKNQRSPLSSAGVYKIPCSCGKVYIGETGRRTVNTRMKEHERDVRLKHVTQSALAKHNLETGHQILFDKTTTLATTTSYFPRKHREVLEIQKHLDNLNRDSGYTGAITCSAETRKRGNAEEIVTSLY
ncbi:uncharacterized protein [Mycetomoellerius zeteki]|uniref:uncharacterized protein n=1 Tax=Mycetomoellerius zeteki TaxID=64791 RepID=UPI00084E98E0|nr:PREDICTED: uncharacterized protein LOC108728692 [Trachymyrmex zeteki]